MPRRDYGYDRLLSSLPWRVNIPCAIACQLISAVESLCGSLTQSGCLICLHTCTAPFRFVADRPAPRSKSARTNAASSAVRISACEYRILFVETWPRTPRHVEHTPVVARTRLQRGMFVKSRDRARFSFGSRIAVRAPDRAVVTPDLATTTDPTEPVSPGTRSI